MKQLKLTWAVLFGAVTIYLTGCDALNLSPSGDDSASAMTDLLFLAVGDDSTSTDSSSHHHHGPCNLTEVAVADLPAAITDYISSNYADATIDRAGTNNGNGNFLIKITKADGTHAGLVFDSEGNFVAEKTKGKRPDAIDVADLPSAITDYITANYPDAEIHKAFLNDAGEYGVILIQADETYLGLGFDADGNFTNELTMKDKMGHKHGPGKGKGGKRGR